MLERRLKRQNVPTNIISSEDDITDSGKLSIFHVHGFLPHRANDINSNVELIFSEEDYHRVYRDAYCWSNLAQLNFLRERTCLFIGCSLTDPNLRRLLDVATRNNEKPRHYAFLRRNHHFSTKGIDIDALNAYKSIDMNLREKYYSTMGLNIIWIEKYDEIPQILKLVEEMREPTLPELLMQYMDERRDERSDWSASGQRKGTNMDLKKQKYRNDKGKKGETCPGKRN